MVLEGMLICGLRFREDAGSGGEKAGAYSHSEDKAYNDQEEIVADAPFEKALERVIRHDRDHS